MLSTNGVSSLKIDRIYGLSKRGEYYYQEAFYSLIIFQYDYFLWQF